MSVNPWVFGKANDRHFGVQTEDEGLTVTQALIEGGLDWNVETRDPQSADTDEIPATGWRQVVRVDDVDENDAEPLIPADAKIVGLASGPLKAYTTLGMVKGRYKVVCNKEAFTFFDNATLEGAAIIRAVGHLDYGRMVWAIAGRPNSVELPNGDEVRSTLVLTTSHDGKSSLMASFAPHLTSTGAVLDIFGRQKVIRIRHTKSASEKLKQAHLLLVKDEAFWTDWRARILGEQDGCYQYNAKTRKLALAKTIITADDVQRVVKGLFPAKSKKGDDGETVETVPTRTENARKALIERYEAQVEMRLEKQPNSDEDDVDCGPLDATALDLFLGASEYVNQDRLVKNDGNQWVAQTFGTGADFRKKAYSLIAGL